MAEADKVSEWPALIDDSGADVVFVEIKRRGASAACRGGRRESTRIACMYARISRPTDASRSNFFLYRTTSAHLWPDYLVYGVGGRTPQAACLLTIA